MAFAVVVVVIIVASVYVTLNSDDTTRIALQQTEWFFQGTAQDPVRYRALSQLIVQWMNDHSFVTRLIPLPFDFDAYHTLRLWQALILLALAYAYYRALGIGFQTTLAGIIALAIMISLSLRPSTFSLDRVTDAIFYLLGGWLVVTNRTLALPVVVLLAALNRETSGFIALLPVAWFGTELLSRKRRRELTVVVLSLGFYTATNLGLRLYIGPAGAAEVPWHDAGFGISNFIWTLRRPGELTHLFTAVSVLPILAAFALPASGAFLRRLYWIMVPAWFVIIFTASWMREGLLFLAPIVVVVLPAVLRAVDAELSSARDRTQLALDATAASTELTPAVDSSPPVGVGTGR